MTLGPSLMTVKGFAATDTLRTFLRAQELCTEVGRGVRVSLPVWSVDRVCVRGDIRKALISQNEAFRQAERGRDAALARAEGALRRWGSVLRFIGDFTGSREHPGAVA
jgi:hypothetical protein